MKKTIFNLLAVVTLCLATTTDIHAQGATEGYFAGNSFIWKYNQDTKTLTISGYGEMPNFTVSWNGDELNTSAPWGEYWRDIETVIVNEGVTTIGKYAFLGLPSLSHVELPTTLTFIGTEAFAETALTSVVIPDKVAVVEAAAFMYDEDLTTIYIGRGIRRLGDPSGNEAQGTGAFAYCKNVTDVYLYSSLTENLSWHQNFEFAEDTDGLGTPAYHDDNRRFHVREGYKMVWEERFPDVHGTFIEDLTGEIPAPQNGQSETSLLPTAGELTPYAIYCQGNQTLYFTNTDQSVQIGSEWDGQSVTSFWHGEQLTDHGWALPGWYETSASNATRVVFDESFQQVRPKSCYAWFAKFHTLQTIEGLEYLNTSEATVMNSMFLYCTSLTSVDVSYFDVSKVTNTTSMFHGCIQLTTIYCSDVWDIDSSSDMFYHCNRLQGAVPFDASKTDATMANPDNGYFTSRLIPYVIYDSFNDPTKLYFIFSEPRQSGQSGKFVWPLNEGANLPGWFEKFSMSSPVTTVVFDESFSRVRPQTCAYWFYPLSGLREIQGIENLNTSRVTDMRHMFEGCSSLTSLDLSGFDVRQVTNASSMFEGCTNLTTIICDHDWHIATTTNMFSDCTHLVGGVSYNPNKVDGSMAKPIEGYFTRSGSLSFDYIECAWNDATHQVEQTVKTANDVEMLNSSKYHLTEGTYIIYENVNYNNRILIDGTVNLILGDGTTMKAPRGIRINPNATLNIFSQSMGSRMGSLIANGDGSDWAAIGGNKDESAGHLFIHGGNITARASKSNAAAIGGGYGDGSGMKSITIYAGKVKAYGQKNAAGIGAGKNNNTRCTITIYGGNITAEGGTSGAGIGGALNRGNHITNIYGGTISAKGGTYGAGIGGGEEGDGGTIKIYGGNITATTGDNPWYNNYDFYAIGGGAKGRKGSLSINDTFNYLMVKKDGQLAGTTFRVSTCQTYGTVQILPCQHELTYLLTDFAQKHKGDCAYCTYKSVGEDHVYENGTCTVCGYNGGKYKVTLHKALSTVGTSYDAGSTYLVSTGLSFELPVITRAEVPDGIVFMDWLQAPTTPTSWEMADNEVLVASGDKITITADTELYARYRYQYPETWQWAPDLSSATLTIEVGNDAIELPVSISSTEGPDYREAVGTAVYERAPGYTYTFTDTRTIPVYQDLVLNEEDNVQSIADNNLKKVNAKLSGRTLFKDDYWNTLCLPFDVNGSAPEASEYSEPDGSSVGSSLDGTPLEGAILKELSSASFNSATATLTLNFVDASSIEAGRPYLIKWTSGANLTPDDLVFPGVTIRNQPDDITCDINDNTSVVFKGTYQRMDFTADDRSVLFLGEGNTLFYPTANATIGAQRAFFQLAGLTAGDLSSEARLFVLNFSDGEPTAISTFQQRQTDEGWYDLNGRRLNTRPQAKGIYIHQGKKYLVP